MQCSIGRLKSEARVKRYLYQTYIPGGTPRQLHPSLILTTVATVFGLGRLYVNAPKLTWSDCTAIPIKAHTRLATMLVAVT